MNKKSLPVIILGIIALAFFSSCSEKFNVAAPYKKITIVYGLLDISDTAHYVRISKAFLDQNQSALVMAQVPDSLYYPLSEINVTINALDNNSNVIKSYSLTRVDLNVEGYPEASGTFSNAHNYAYKFKGGLNPAYSYQIVVKNTITGEEDSSITQIIDTSRTNNAFTIDDGYIQGITNNPFYQPLTRVSTTSETDIEITGRAPGTAKFFQGIIRVHWTDSNRAASSHVLHTADWTFDSEPAVNGGGSYDLKGPVLDFYYFLRDNIGPAPSGITRYLTGLDVIIYAGNNDLYQYQQTGLLQGTGIAGIDAQPAFTNIKGNYVEGLFAARGEIANYGYIYENTATRDSILQSPTIQSIIGSLNIVDVTHF